MPFSFLKKTWREDGCELNHPVVCDMHRSFRPLSSATIDKNLQGFFFLRERLTFSLFTPLCYTGLDIIQPYKNRPFFIVLFFKEAASCSQ